MSKKPLIVSLLAAGLVLTLNGSHLNAQALTTADVKQLPITTVSITNIQQFPDVSEKHWAYSTIQWGVREGLIKGYPDGTFRPNRSVTEAEFLAMLIRAYKPSDFNESKVQTHWADAYYDYAVNMNYPNLGAVFKERRNSPINRTMVAEIVSSTQGVNYDGRDAIHYLLQEGLAKGKKANEVTIESYAGSDYLTRAEAVAFIKNVIDKGMKDENGKPVMKPRPLEPSDPNQLTPLPDEEKKKEKGKSTGGGKLLLLEPEEIYGRVKDDMAKLGFRLKYENIKGLAAMTFIDSQGQDILYVNHGEIIQIASNYRTEDVYEGVKILLRAINVPVTEEVEFALMSEEEVVHVDTETIGLSVYKREHMTGFSISVARKMR